MSRFASQAHVARGCLGISLQQKVATVVESWRVTNADGMEAVVDLVLSIVNFPFGGDVGRVQTPCLSLLFLLHVMKEMRRCSQC